MQDNERQQVIAENPAGERVNTRLPLLTARQRAILVGVLADQRHLSALPGDADVGLSQDQLGRRRVILRNAQAGLVPMNLAGWLGHVPSNSECVLCHRQYVRLEGMGLVERHNLRRGRRTSHLRLTPAGRWVVETLLAEDFSAATDEAVEPIDIGDLDMSSLVALLEMHEAENDAQ